MSTFPPQLRFPKQGGKITKLPQGSPVYSKFQDFECEGHIFTTILDDPDDLIDDYLYYFIGVHMIIPSYFAPLDVDLATGTVLGESNDPFGIEINQYFALRMRTVATPTPLWNGNIQFSLGPANCGEPGNNGEGDGGSGGQGLAGNGSFIFDDDGEPLSNLGQMPNNIHRLFFKFQDHYFTPVLLSSGLVCYYAFEHKKEIENWVRKLTSGDIYAAAIDYEIYLDNILRIPISKKVSLLRYDPLTEKYIKEE